MRPCARLSSDLFVLSPFVFLCPFRASVIDKSLPRFYFLKREKEGETTLSVRRDLSTIAASADGFDVCMFLPKSERLF